MTKMPFIHKNEITISAIGFASCAIIRLAAVRVYCILSGTANSRTASIINLWEGSAV